MNNNSNSIGIESASAKIASEQFLNENIFQLIQLSKWKLQTDDGRYGDVRHGTAQYGMTRATELRAVNQHVDNINKIVKLAKRVKWKNKKG